MGSVSPGDQLLYNVVPRSRKPSVGMLSLTLLGKGKDALAKSSAFPNVNPCLFIFVKLVFQLNKY